MTDERQTRQGTLRVLCCRHAPSCMAAAVAGLGALLWLAHSFGTELVFGAVVVLSMLGLARVLVLFGRDADALRSAEGRLHRLATAVDQANEAILISDTDGTIQYVNPAFERISGYSSEEAVGENTRILKSGKHAPAFYRELWETLGRGEVWHGRFTNRRKDGSLYEEVGTISPIRGPDGKITNFVAVKRNVTDELLLEAQLRQAQKLESIGQLAAGIAHEINTPTQYVGDNMRFLEEAFADLAPVLEGCQRLIGAARGESHEPPARALAEDLGGAMLEADLAYLEEEIPRAIGESLQGVERVTKIVRAMKEFSHPGQEEMAPADLNGCIQSTITVATNEWKYVAEVVKDLDPELPPVPCLAGEFNQVVLNLLVNAAHAIADVVGDDGAGGKGTITVRTRAVEGWAEVSVQDTGTGIPEADRDKVFDPFFTKKEIGKGTGQGLAIAHSVVVTKHGGTITFESALGEGTTFVIRLPLSPLAAPAERVNA